MNNTIVYLFIIIISISIYIFYSYNEIILEDFAVPVNNYVVSDLFPNVTTSNYIEIPCYSTIQGIQNEFINFIKDYKNYRGYIDTQDDTKNYTYTESGQTIKDIKINVEMLNNEGLIGYMSGDITPYPTGYALFYSGGFVPNGMTGSPPEYRYADRLRNTKWPDDITNPRYSGRLNLNEQRDSSKYKSNFNAFKQYVLENSVYAVNKFLERSIVYNYQLLKDRLKPESKYLYNFTNYYTKSFWKPTGAYFPLTEYALTAKDSGCFYNIGELLANFPSRDTDIDRGALEKLRMYVYGSVNTAQSNDLKESAFWGSLFNFSNVSMIDLFLRVSYNSSNLNGLDLFYSHGLFSNDVQIRSAQQFYLYDPNNANIAYNNTIINYRDYTNNTLSFPASSHPSYINGNPTSVTCNVSFLDLKQQFVGTLSPRLVAKMPPILRKYITSWSYNKTIRILNRRLEECPNNNEKFYFLMGLALNNYYYSKNINDTDGANAWKGFLAQYGLNNPDTTFGPVVVGHHSGNNLSGNAQSYNIGIAYPSILGYFNPSVTSAYSDYPNSGWWYIKSQANITNAAGFSRTINSHGTLPTITSALLSEMNSYYTSCIQKLVPEYGPPLNVLDQKNLDKIAQQFYELTNGLHEIIFFYDVFRIGSNMIDIRFDKKQRFDNMKYLTLRNQYVPQLNEYNTLLNTYDDGTWVKSYSNIDDFSSALSTSIGKLEPIFNPVFPIGGEYTYKTLTTKLNANNIVMDTLSNKLTVAISGIQSQTIGTNGSNVSLSNIVQASGNANVVGDISVLTEQYNSTINSGQLLSNLVNGIETNVARLFITVVDSSTFIINGISLGINAALSFNTMYNGNIDVPLTGQGNANYNPTIQYTKNIVPPIQCGNPTFMNKVANLYRDTLFTDISNVTLSNINYDPYDGFVVVDKIIGFSQIDNNTCGYTWIETQYDDYTNKPVKRNTVNIRTPFTFDNTEYQNSKLIFDNDRTKMKYGATQYPFGNLNDWIIRWKNDMIISQSNNIIIYQSNLNNYTSQINNLVGSNAFTIFDYTTTPGWSNYQNADGITYTGNTCYDLKFNTIYYRAPPTQIRINSTEIKLKDYIRDTFAGKTYLEISMISKYAPYIINRKDPFELLNNINSLDVDIYVRQGNYYDTEYKFQRALTYNYGNFNLIRYMQNDPDPYVMGLYLGIFTENSIVSMLNSNLNNTNKLSLQTLALSRYDSITLLSEAQSQLASVIPISVTLSNTQQTNYQLQQYIFNNTVIIPRYLSDADISLTDSDGACPRLRCDNPDVMTQIMEQYNTDSNNSDRIISILNSYTVNRYQCDYKVITASNLATMLSSKNTITNLNNQITTLQNQIVPIQNQINTVNDNYRAYLQTPEGNQLRNSFVTASYALSAKAVSLLQNKFMPNNFPLNTTLYTVLNNTAYNWTTYIKRKYVDNTFNSNLNNVDLEKILIPLSLNLPVDYPYPNENNSITQPLNFQLDSEYNTLYSNYSTLNYRYYGSNIEQNRNLQNQITPLQNQIRTLQNQITNLQNQNSSNAERVTYKSFDVGIDVRDCSYYYGSNNNTGYFCSDNQNPTIVPNNKSGATGFYYITTTFSNYLSDVVNKINPLIDEGIKQSSNMFNAVLNQRLDTYDALGKLNMITFSNNIPPLQTSNILYMLQNNKRFLNSVLISYPHDTYLKSIKGFGITNSNTLQLLIDSANIIRTSSNVSLGAITTKSVEYNIRATDSNYLDYTAYYMGNISLNLQQDFVLNMLNSMPYTSSSNLTIPNIIPLSNYVKLIQNSNYSWNSNCPPIQWHNIFNDSIKTVGYLPEDIDSFNFLQNVAEFKLKTTESLSYSKKFFRLTAANRTGTSNCSNYNYVFSEGDVRTSLKNFIGNLSNQNLIDIFRTTYNRLNLISNGDIYSPTVGKIFSANFNYNKPNSLFYSCSLLYKDKNNNYDLTRIPNDIMFNNPKYYQVNFIYSAEQNKYFVETYSETSPFSGVNINDSNGLNTDRNFYITRFLYRKIRLSPLIPLNTSYDQTSCQLLFIEFYKNNVKKDSSAFSIDIYNTDLESGINNAESILYYPITSSASDLLNATLNVPYIFNNKPARITLNLTAPTSLDGFSLVTGMNPNKSIRRWNIEGSVDGTTFFTLHFQSTDYNYPNVTQFYRTPLFSFDTSVANSVLPQYPMNIYTYSLNECTSFNPIDSGFINGLYNDFNNSTVINYNGEALYYIILLNVFGYKISSSTNLVIYFVKLRFVDGATPQNNYNVYLKLEKRLGVITDCANIQFVDRNYSDITVLPVPATLEPSFSGYNLTGFTMLNTNNTFNTCGINPVNTDIINYITSLLTTRFSSINNLSIRRYFYNDNGGYGVVYYLFSYLLTNEDPIRVYYAIYNIPYIIINCQIIIRNNIPTLYGPNTSETTVINYFSSANWVILSSGFENYDKKYLVSYVKFESKTPLLFDSIILYDKSKNHIHYKVKDKVTNSITLEIKEPIFGYSFVTNNSGTSPNSWSVKASDGKIWESIHEYSYNLQNKKLYQTPIFFLDGNISTIEQPQSKEKPEIDINKFIKYYKQKINSSVNPEFKKYMYSNNTYYFIFDEYDLNKNLVEKDLIIGFEVNGNKIKKALLYEDDDGNYKPFDLRNSKQKDYWDKNIGLELQLTAF